MGIGIDNLSPAFKSAELILGNAIHQILESFYRALADGEILSAEETEELFELRLRWLCGNSGEIRYKDGQDYQTLLAQGKDLVRCFCDNVPDEDSRVVAVEEAFSFDIP